MSALIVAGNHLEACQSWQEIISAQPDAAAKDLAGREALEALKGQTYLGVRKLIVGGDAAMFFPDGADSLSESLWPYVQFGELKALGWLGRLSYKRIREQAFLD